MRSLLRALLNSAGIKDVVEAAHGQAGIESTARAQDPIWC